jgi:hypothetical protein
LPRTLFALDKTVGEATDRILAALSMTGYVERSFLRTPAEGIALITRLERINEDGSRVAEGRRWPVTSASAGSPDLGAMLRGLFYVESGYYRIIVFILQRSPFSQSPESISEAKARDWLRAGANVLPSAIADRPLDRSNCTVLIYEFANDGSAVKWIESRLTGEQHLNKAGLMTALQRPRPPP